MNLYGNYFKKIRKRRGFTLKQVSNGIVPPSSISRFENGESDMYFGNVVSALGHMGSSLEELLTELDELNDAYYIDSIKLIISEQNVKKLITIKNHHISMFEVANNPLDAALYKLARIHINHLQNIKINQSDLDDLNDFLFASEDWGEFEYYIFGIIAEFLNTKTLINYSENIFYGEKKFRLSSISDVALSSVLHTIFLLIIRNEITNAKYFLDNIEQITINADILSDRIIYSFYREITEYKIRDQKIPDFNELKTINSLKELKINWLNSELNNLYSSIVNK
ncbi:MAG: hypothetical protein LBC17_03980 [Lactobacillaceae bacterium]|jgi:Rgg/GadR/MutR family transcriptional activator|nr:hypothetical protein [Lactobacillaceae bacterium]